MRLDQHDAAGRIEYIRGQLELIEHPLDLLDEFDHVTYADYTLGEQYHATKVLTRLLPFMIDAAQRENGDATPDHLWTARAIARAQPAHRWTAGTGDVRTVRPLVAARLHQAAWFTGGRRCPTWLDSTS